ncbi:MAG: HYC_CC_PP family protein [Paludibacter sp.]
MKKIISILFAILILLSGMHLSVATHWCGGEVSQVKLSFAHEKASCGMCGEEESIPVNGISSEGCCKDEMSFYVVDSNFSPSTFQTYQPTYQFLQVFDIPKTIGILFLHTNSITNINVQPPGNYIASAVSLPDICVFRI